MGFLDPEEILIICYGYSGKGYYTEYEIPKSKLSDARVAFKIPVAERILALLDTTGFGFGSTFTGLAIGSLGLYWKNKSVKTEKNFLSWEEFANVIIEQKDRHTIELGPGNLFNMKGASFDIVDLIELLLEIQMYVSSTFRMRASKTKFKQDNNQNPPPPPQTNKWMVALFGQQYGPYDLDTLENLVKSGQIQPEFAYVWKPGMSAWIPFTQQQELSAIAKISTLSPPPIPTAPPVAAAPAAPSEAEAAQHAADAKVNQPYSEQSGKLVDINTASYEELVEILGLKAVGAKKIIQEREANGGFETPEQVGQLLGLKPHQVEKLRKKVRFTPLSENPGKKRSRVVDF